MNFDTNNRHMKTYRLGNTITIRWTISLANGEPFTLNPETVELVAIAPHHSTIIDDFTVDSNVLTWIFKGSEQKYLGPYTLTLIQNRGKVDMVTVDICEAFALVPWSCMAGGNDDAAGVETESLEISSTVSATQVTLSPEVEAAIKTATDPKQDKEDPTLQTKDKTIPGAINELVSAVFPLSISVTGGGVYKKGTIQAITVRWTIKAGSEIVEPDTLKINGALETNTNTSKQFTGVTSTTTYTVEATRNGVVKSSSTTATFVNPSYIGVVASDFSASESSIKGLTEVVKSGKGYTASGLNLVNQKICYAYPKTFGALSSIKDANGFENISAYTRSEETVNGEAYYVYVLTDPASQSNVKQIYA